MSGRSATWKAAIAVALALALPAAAHAQSVPRCGVPGQPVRFFDTLAIDGVQRSALVNVPPNATAASLPLIFAFHGASATGPFMEAYSGLTPLADRAGFIVVYPTAHDRLWDSSAHDADPEEDVTFMRSLLDDLEARLCVDPSRVYATGVSNGGSFTARLGCEMSDRLTAIAPVAGGYGVEPPCRPVRPVSVLEVHGTDDWVVPYAGKGRAHSGSVPAYLAMWQRLDACSGSTVKRRLSDDVDFLYTRGCAPGTIVEHVRLVGGPHIWPGTTLLSPGDPAGVPFAASVAVLQFFERRTVSRAALLRR